LLTAGGGNWRARYVGFARSRLRDASERYVPITDYIAWTAEVADELSDANRARSSVFERYAAVVEGISEDEAQPVSILLDPSQDSFIDMREDEAVAAAIAAQDDVDYLDLCSDIDPENGEFQIRIGEEVVDCSIKYRPELRKYRLVSERLNELFSAREHASLRDGHGALLISVAFLFRQAACKQLAKLLGHLDPFCDAAQLPCPSKRSFHSHQSP